MIFVIFKHIKFQVMLFRAKLKKKKECKNFTTNNINSI